MENNTNTINNNVWATPYSQSQAPSPCSTSPMFYGGLVAPGPNPNAMMPGYDPDWYKLMTDNPFATRDAVISSILSANVKGVIGNDSSKETETKVPVFAHRLYILPELTKDRQIYDSASDKCSNSEKELLKDLSFYHATGKYAIGIWEDRPDNRIIFDGEEYAWDGKRFKACKSISMVTGKINERILEPIYNVGVIVGIVDKETEKFRYPDPILPQAPAPSSAAPAAPANKASE